MSEYNHAWEGWLVDEVKKRIKEKKSRVLLGAIDAVFKEYTQCDPKVYRPAVLQRTKGWFEKRQNRKHRAETEGLLRSAGITPETEMAPETSFIVSPAMRLEAERLARRDPIDD